MALKKGLLSTEIALDIEELIHNQELKVGDQLPNEIALSERLGVSRTTVREAVKTLSAKGFVEIRRGIGTFVCNMPGVSSDSLGLTFVDKSSLIHELYQFRMMIEPDIVALAAENATEENLVELKKAYKRFIEDHHAYYDHKIGIATASKRYIDNEIHFHTNIAKCTGNSVIERVVFVIMESYARTYWSDNFIPEDLIYNEKHKDIVNAIVKGDGKGARNEMVKHLIYAQKFFSDRNAQGIVNN